MMIESRRGAASLARSQRAIEFGDNTFVVDAALFELLHLPVSRVPIVTRAGRITSVRDSGDRPIPEPPDQSAPQARNLTTVVPQLGECK
jgi:hypothetical protein